MLDVFQLHAALNQAVDDFVERVDELIPAPSPRPLRELGPVSPFGKKVLHLVSKHPRGATANQLADQAEVGLGPMFDELRELMEANRVLRVVRGNDQLPIYVLPDSSSRF